MKQNVSVPYASKSAFGHVVGFLACLCGVVCGGAPLSWGARDELVSSIHHGGNPYLLSIEDPQGLSQRPPGVYVRRDGQQWVPIIHGNILSHNIQGGALYQLEISGIDHRYEMLSVLDGKVYLYHINSKLNDPASVITVGSSDHPVIDLLSRQKVKVPNIKEIKDLSFFSPPMMPGAKQQLLVLSIQSEHPLGSGMTFALVLQAADEKAASITIGGSIALLDYDFHPPKELERLAVLNDKQYGVIPIPVLRQLAAGHAREPIPVSEWKADLEKKIERFSKFDGIMSSEALPYYLLETGEVVLRNVPRVEKLLDCGFGVIQEYGMLGKADTIQIMGDSRVVHFPGRFDMKEGGEGKKEFHIYEGEASFVAFIHRQPYLFYKSRGQHFLHGKLSPPVQAFPNDFSFYVLDPGKQEKEGRNVIRVFVSQRSGESKLTELLTFTPTQSGELVVTDSFKIGQEFFTSADLERRVGDEHLFDFLTPPQATDEAYRQTCKETAPYIDLNKSTSRGIVYKFKKPTEEKQIFPGGFYRLYDDDPRLDRQTGVYIVEREKEPKALRGQVLAIQKILPASAPPPSSGSSTGTPPKETTRQDVPVPTADEKGKEKEQEEQYLLAEGLVRVSVDESNIPIQVKVIAMDATYQNGKESFTLQVILTANGDYGGPWTKEVKVELPMRALEGVRIIPGKKDNQGQFVLLYTLGLDRLDPATRDHLISYGSTRRGAFGVKGILFDTHLKKNKKDEWMFEVTPGYVGPVGSEPIPASEYADYLLFDKKGRVYWNMTQGLGINHRDLKVLSFAHAGKISPNDPAEKRKLDVYFDESVRDEEDHNAHLSWRAFQYDVRDHLKKLNGGVEGKPQESLYEEIDRILDELADTEKPAKHWRVLVPPELFDYVQKYIYAKYVSGHDLKYPNWSVNNRALRLYLIKPEKASQEEILENLSGIQKTVGRERPVLVTTLKEMMKIGRAEGHEKGAFKVTGLDLKSSKEGVFDGAMEVQENKKFPHLAYLLETEGERIDLTHYAESSVRKRASIPMLFLGTTDEAQVLMSEMEIPEGESLFGDVWQVPSDITTGSVPVCQDDGKHGTCALTLPNRETRERLVLRAFEREAIRSLRYQYVLTDPRTPVSASPEPALTQEQSLKKMAGYIVGRCEQLSRQSNGKSQYASFMKFITLLTFRLINDTATRRSRVVDRAFIEGILSVAFSIPVNVGMLPPEDPLIFLHRERAPLDWHRAGFRGANELKQDVIGTILSQTRTTPGKQIPSSIAIIGESGTGKTHLFKTLVEMLKLRVYRLKSDDDLQDESQAFILNAGKLNKREASIGYEGYGDAQEALMDMDQFLAGSKGYRGFILIDDLGAAPSEPRRQIIARIRELFEAPNGVYTAKTKDGDSIEVPVQNLTIVVTMNHSSDSTAIIKAKGDTPEARMMIAALSDKECPVDDSFFKRFGLLLVRNKFAPDAKAPELIETVRRNVKQVFGQRERLILMSPRTVDSIVDRFVDPDARSFLSAAPGALLEKAETHMNTDSKNQVFMLVPQEPTSMPEELPNGFRSATEASSISSFISNSVRVVPVRSDLVEGKVELLRLMLHNFRLQLYEIFVEAVLQDERFSLNQERQTQVMTPILQAANTHLAGSREFPLNQIRLDPFDLGITSREEQQQFIDQLRISENKVGFIRIPEMRGGGDIFDRLTHTAAVVSKGEPRGAFLTRIQGKVFEVVTRLMARTLQMPDARSFPEAREWLQGMSETPMTADEKEKMGLELTAIMGEFFGKLSEHLPAAVNLGVDFTIYDMARFFLVLLDQSVSTLPWGKTTSFLTGAVNLATSDVVLTQHQPVQSFLFENESSLMRLRTDDYLNQLFLSSRAFKSWKPERVSKVAGAFPDKCKTMLEHLGKN